MVFEGTRCCSRPHTLVDHRFANGQPASALGRSGKRAVCNDVTQVVQSVHCVVNGEFYGYDKIRSKYAAQGVRRCWFACYSRNDAQATSLSRIQRDSVAIVSRAWQLIVRASAGNALCLPIKACVQGEFAFALWDDKRQSLLAARDRFGIKPVYYTVHNVCHFALDCV